MHYEFSGIYPFPSFLRILNFQGIYPGFPIFREMGDNQGNPPIRPQNDNEQ